MEFMITKISSRGECPHQKAYEKKYTRIDIRTTDNPSKIEYYRGNEVRANAEWFGVGKNHRLINGQIARDFDDKAWFVKISNLKELIEFQNSCGYEIIIGDSFNNPNIKCIEIYDDYRE